VRSMVFDLAEDMEAAGLRLLEELGEVLGVELVGATTVELADASVAM